MKCYSISKTTRHLFVFGLALTALSVMAAEYTNEPPKAIHGNARHPGAKTIPEIDDVLERWEGGSKEAEEKIRRQLVDKFVQLQTAIGARSGGNLRGTHSDGICMGGTLELYELSDPALKVGPFGKARTIKDVHMRFADAASFIEKNQNVKDVRAVSFGFEVDGQRQDFSMNNGPTFTFGSITNFNNYMAFSLFMAAKGEAVRAGKIPPKDIAKLQQVIAAKTAEIDPNDPNIKAKIAQVTQEVTGQFIMGEIQEAFFAKNPDIAQSVAISKKHGDQQKNKDVYSYQTENYGTGSAFSYGRDKDGNPQAAKFSLERCNGEPPKREPIPKGASPTILKDRLKPKEVCFELKLDLLDADNMLTEDGKKLEPWQWVADATLDWDAAKKRAKDGEPPKKHILGKLTGNPDSISSPAKCNDVANAYDVNTNRFDAIKPLGPINRARREAESLSQRMRSPAVSHAGPLTPFHKTEVLKQGWDRKTSNSFWWDPQGSYIIPKSIFKALQATDPDPKTGKPRKFTDTLPELGFINAPWASEKYNPDGFPIGLTSEDEPTGDFPHLKGKGPYVGFNCATCHTSAVIDRDGVRKIIEGGPSKVDYQRFSMKLEESLKATLDDEAKFKALHKETDGKVTRDILKKEYDQIYEINTSAFFPGKDRSNPPLQSIPGATDAFAVILDRVVNHGMGFEKKDIVGNAQVSFPKLWGAAFAEWIQYSGLSNLANSRNDGEGKGVRGHTNLDPSLPNYLETTVRTDNQRKFERAMRLLDAPKYEKVFGTFTPEQNKLIAKGKEIFHSKEKGNCISCHRTEIVKKPGQHVTMVPATEFKADFSRQDYIGTDPTYFANLASRWSQVDTGKFAKSSPVGRLLERDPGLLDRLRFYDDKKGADGTVTRGRLGKEYLAKITGIKPYGEKENGVVILAHVTTAQALMYMADPKNNIVIGPSVDPRTGKPIESTKEYVDLTGDALPKTQTAIGAFAAPNLAGVWATAPYLHTHSVPNLRELLSPTTKRSTQFGIGDEGFDEENVGFKNRGTTFEANTPGHLPIGHHWGTSLSAPDKEALIWYLKSI